MKFHLPETRPLHRGGVVASAAAALLAVTAAAGAAQNGSEPTLSAARIVERNVAARGGLDAWRKIHAMLWAGHIERAGPGAGDAPQFVLAMERPNKTRFEMTMKGRRHARIYDGSQGWKLSMGSDGAPALEAYDEEERRFAADGQGFDGPLIDGAAKGNRIALEGTEDVEGHRAYRLGVTLPSGAMHHVWVDAQSFLDVEYDRPVHEPHGPGGAVKVFNRDFKTFGAVQVPTTIETRAGNGALADRMILEKVEIEPGLDPRMFTRPNVRERSSANGGHLRRVDPPKPAATSDGRGGAPAGSPPAAADSVGGR
ncbi:MAG: hypothetical protein HY749_14775 [Gammaproteobacteria bacterium]|nr:hypothetical protein [Gammaproteobacteria bacterium]